MIIEVNQAAFVSVLNDAKDKYNALLKICYQRGGNPETDSALLQIKQGIDLVNNAYMRTPEGRKEINPRARRN